MVRMAQTLETDVTPLKQRTKDKILSHLYIGSLGIVAIPVLEGSKDISEEI